jgi:hypothetical protein
MQIRRLAQILALSFLLGAFLSLSCASAPQAPDGTDDGDESRRSGEPNELVSTSQGREEANPNRSSPGPSEYHHDEIDTTVRMDELEVLDDSELDRAKTREVLGRFESDIRGCAERWVVVAQLPLPVAQNFEVRLAVDSRGRATSVRVGLDGTHDKTAECIRKRFQRSHFRLPAPENGSALLSVSFEISVTARSGTTH